MIGSSSKEYGRSEVANFGPEIFRIQARGGVSRYIVELHRGLVRAGVDSAIEAGWHLSDALGGVPEVHGRRSPVGGRPGKLATLVVDELVADTASRRLQAGDVWHPSYYPRTVPSGRGRPLLAITVLDMIHERFAWSMPPRDRSAERKAAACAAADLVLCISHDTARDLQERLQVDPPKVVVTHLGVAPVVPVPRSSPFGDRPYLVYVGDRRAPYKNWATLLDALRTVPADVGLLCIGAPASAADEAEVRSRGLTGRVRFEGGTDAEVAGRLFSVAI